MKLAVALNYFATAGCFLINHAQLLIYAQLPKYGIYFWWIMRILLYSFVAFCFLLFAFCLLSDFGQHIVLYYMNFLALYRLYTMDMPWPCIYSFRAILFVLLAWIQPLFMHIYCSLTTCLGSTTQIGEERLIFGS